MKRREVRRNRRRYAILGVLAEYENASARAVADALWMDITDVQFALQLLEHHGRIVGERVMPLTPTAPSRIYRLPRRPAPLCGTCGCRLETAICDSSLCTLHRTDGEK